MRGAKAKRGTHGLRKRCPCCKKLRKFAHPPAHDRVEGWTKVGDQWICRLCSEKCTWHCFECDKTVVVRPTLITRDDGRWMKAPPDWLFANDHGELTFLCSEKCIKAIYARND